MVEASRRIGRYEVVRPIAAGDTAELFLAKQVGLEGFERIVFIKRIRDELAASEEFVRAFLDEARLVAKLAHPNVVEVYDLGKDGQAYFVAMEYVQSRTLSRVAGKTSERGQKMPPPLIARCISEVCGGLHYAHTMVDAGGRLQNIIHGAISPRKILVSFTGISKIRDFGIAKAATILAETGVLKGRYGYMSPEQVQRKPLDARSDVFALGAILYELLTGVHPFRRGNSILTLTAIAEEPHIPLRKLRPELPEKLAETVDRALSKKRGQRFESASALQLELEDYLAEAPRSDAGEIRRFMQNLFADELKPGEALFDIAGVGEIILPESDTRSVKKPSVKDHITVPMDSDTEIAPFLDHDTALEYEGHATVPAVFDVEETSIPGPETGPIPEEDETNIPAGRTANYQTLDEPQPEVEIKLDAKKRMNQPPKWDPPKPKKIPQEEKDTEAAESLVPGPSIGAESMELTRDGSLDPEAAIAEAFAGPSNVNIRVPDAIRLPTEAFEPIKDLDPQPHVQHHAEGQGEPQAGAGGKPKREIVEIVRPHPHAPTEFQSGLQEPSLARPQIPSLPSIVRERYDDLGEPRVEVSSARPTPKVLPGHPPAKVAKGTGTPPSKLVLPMPAGAQFAETAELPAHLVDPAENTGDPPPFELRIPAPPAPPPPSTGLFAAVTALPTKVLLAIAGALLMFAVMLVVISVQDEGVRITVYSTPPGGVVFVNGQLQQRPTPVIVPGIKLGGTYQVRVVLEGYSDGYKTVVIPEGTKNLRIDVPLERLPPR